MQSTTGARASSLAFASLLLGFGCVAGGTGTESSNTGTGSGTDGGIGSGSDGSCGNACVTRTDLVSNVPGLAKFVDPNMINAWGVVASNGNFWISDNTTGKVSVVDATGAPTALNDVFDLGKGITAVALNTTTAFVVSGATVCAPAKFIFASEGGTLIAVNPDVDRSKGFVVVDGSSVAAAYKGLGIVTSSAGTRLLAADFHNARIAVFDETFKLVSTTMFVNPQIPAGFAPFNVQAFGGTVYVTYAQVNPVTGDDISGPGLGYVSAFDASGKLEWTVNDILLNAPWGLAIAPSNFTKFSNALLVGNFGDGRITAIDRTTQKVLGQLEDAAAAPIVVDGLWGLTFGDGINGSSKNTLYFAAGPVGETQGLFGALAPCH
jgi:uncharacterized protein (TIGR03118 family)